ncbi:MAG: hypothetical protein J07HX64_00414 [halophilic archaeon J07HX64]|jgi:hypothetical protein|nr:MAG: hypothetical protein J07HX64_00414 [halophilic archaeon J07HX64]
MATTPGSHPRVKTTRLSTPTPEGTSVVTVRGTSTRHREGSVVTVRAHRHRRGDIPEPTPQSAALRRQQQYVGIGGAFVAGVALGVGTLQRFPDTPVLAALAGLIGTALVLWLVRKSVFPGESTA